jgi:hypothetical protein
MLRRVFCVGLTAIAVAWAVSTAPVSGQDEPKGPAAATDRPSPPVPSPISNPSASLHEGFETNRTTWMQEETDVEVNLQAHDRTARAVHEGQRSEHFKFIASGPGNLLFYSLALGKIPVSEKLKASLWVRSNQPGAQLLGRVVLPNDSDPTTGQASFVLVPGASYDAVDSWQRLTLADLPQAVERQARVLRHTTKRKVSLEGAYLERVVINLYGGSGQAEVFLDDLDISPVPDEAVLPSADEPQSGVAETPIPDVPAAANANANASAKSKGKGKVEMLAGRLKRDGHEWIPSILYAPKIELETAYAFGFDVLAVDFKDVETARAAVKLGFMLMPMLGALKGGAGEITAAMNAYPLKASVAFWDLGEQLGSSTDAETRNVELERMRAIVTAIRDLPDDTPKLTTGEVAGLYPQYALPGQNFDLMGVDPVFWATAREVADTYQFLQARRNLTALWNQRAPYWAWVDATMPLNARAAIWGEDTPPAWGDPRLQPEQVRVGAYLTLMAGYRGLGFRADDRLTADAGRPCLYELGLVNAEVDLVQAILAKGTEPILSVLTYPPDPKPIIIYNANQTMGSMGNRTALGNQTFPETKPHGSIKAVSIPTEDLRGRLILIADAAGGMQWQPPQSAINNLKVVVPGVPENAMAYEICLGGVRYLESDRPPGGRRFTVPEFNVATMVLLTTDAAMVERLKAAVIRIRPRAVDLAIKQAKRQLKWVTEINAMLVKDDHKAKDAGDLLSTAQENIEAAEAAQAREDYTLAYDEARRVGRPLRLMMREHWEKARDVMGAKVKFNSEEEWKKLHGGDSKADEPKTASRDTRKDVSQNEKDRKVPKMPGQNVPAVASPPVLAFNTLPQHYIWADWAADGIFGRNLLPSGRFEVDGPKELVDAGWADAGYHYEKVKSFVLLLPEGADLKKKEKKKDGESKDAKKDADKKDDTKPSAKDAEKAEDASDPKKDESAKQTAASTATKGKILCLSVRPLDPKGIDNLTAFLDHPAAAVQSPPIPVEAAQLVRIRVKVRMPRALPAGSGGVIIRDSLGGEALEFRQTEAINNWTEVVLLRRVATDGDLTVTLGLAGFGDAYFDDLRIDRLEKTRSTKKTNSDQNVARTPRLSAPRGPLPVGRRPESAYGPSIRRSVR